MTVEELIDLLKQRNPEAHVFIESIEGINSLVGIVADTDPDDVTLVDSTVIPMEDTPIVSAPASNCL